MSTKPFDEIAVDLGDGKGGQSTMALLYKGEIVCWVDFPNVLPGDTVHIKDVLGTIVLPTGSEKEDG